MLTSVTSPTYPKSLSSIFLAFIKEPSIPHNPRALPPNFSIKETKSLFTFPPRTIWTTSMVTSSVYLNPFINSLLWFNLFSKSEIAGPPPWTTTGSIPTHFINIISLITVSFSSSFIIAFPPYFITMVFPRYFWIYGSAWTNISALSEWFKFNTPNYYSLQLTVSS